MKISFITTIYNEETSIEKFLISLLAQTKKPDEIIIVDGRSTDKTIERIKNYESRIKDKKVVFNVLIKKGNRSVGRNEAIRHATGNIIVCSDSGNILDKNWIENIIEPFKNKNVDVVAGYYQGLAKSVFQKCLLPYAFVMPDKIDPNNFLPATRSIAFTKSIWEKVRRFNEKLSHNEDYAFAKSLQKMNANIVFKKDAIVYWIPRSTFKQAFIMFFRFAYGDAEARIWRPKVVFLFVRYIVAILLLILAIIKGSIGLIYLLVFLALIYLVWAIVKNYRYVNAWQAIFILPTIQLVADVAVISGTIDGLVKIWDIKKMS
jgi:glycosyltransferase involved in cell wall biosynthesis